MGYKMLMLVNDRNIQSRSLHSHSPSSSSSCTPVGGWGSPQTPSPKPETRKRIEKWYNDLVRMGGRPGFPLELSFVNPKSYGEYADIIKYLGDGTGFLKQREAWIRFRKFQRRNRRTTDTFDQYRRDMYEYWQKEGVEVDIRLLFDAKQQTKVDEWKEYYYFEHRELGQMRVEAEKGRQQREQERIEWEATHGTGKKLDPSEPSDVAWIYRMASETELDRFTFFLGWIEQQIPKIARECEPPSRDTSRSPPNALNQTETSFKPEVAASTGIHVTESMNGSCRRATKGENPRNSILKPVTPKIISKAGRKEKHSIHDTGTVQHRDTASKVTRAQTRSARAYINSPIQNIANASIEPPTQPITLRRSQRLKDLRQSKSSPKEAENVNTKPSSKRKPKTSLQARSLGVKKSRTTRKKHRS